MIIHIKGLSYMSLEERRNRQAEMSQEKSIIGLQVLFTLKRTTREQEVITELGL